MGGGAGSARIVGKGQRRLMTKGIRMGSYVRIYYRVPGKPGAGEKEIEYEGKIVDKRVGGQDRESYVELENCMELDPQGRLVETTPRKRLIDAFIELCKVVEKRETPPEPAPKPVEEPPPPPMMTVGNGMMPGTLPGGMPGMMPGMMQGMAPGMMQGMMPGMMPGQGMMMQGQMPDGMQGQMQAQMPDQMQGQMQAQMQGQMPGQMPGQMQGQLQGQMPGQVQGDVQGQIQGQMQGQAMMQGQGMMPGVMPGMMQPMMPGMMQPMMMPGMMQPMMAPMGMMPMGMGGMMMVPTPNMMAPGAAATTPAIGNGISGAPSTTFPSSGGDAKPEKASSSRGGSDSVADFELGSSIRIKYQHPSMGKITYEGILVEKQLEGTNHESFIQLQDCKRVSSSSKIREREESKRLMSAFINDARLLGGPSDAPAAAAETAEATEATEGGPETTAIAAGDSEVPRPKSRSRSKRKKEKKSRKKSAGRGSSNERSRSRGATA